MTQTDTTTTATKRKAVATKSPRATYVMRSQAAGIRMAGDVERAGERYTELLAGPLGAHLPT